MHFEEEQKGKNSQGDTGEPAGVKGENTAAGSDDDFSFYEKGPVNTSIIEDENSSEETSARVLDREGQYIFDFEKYNNQSSDEQNAAKMQSRFANRSMRTVAFVMISILGLMTIFFAGVGVYNLITGGTGGRGESEMEYDPGTLIIREAPNADSSNAPSQNSSSAKQAAAKVSPSVVSVLCYSGDSTMEPTAYGAGVVQSADGNIITNSHILEGAGTIKVIMSNKEEHTATLVGADKKTNLAVIKIDAKNLTVAEFGNSDKLAAGEDVLSVGNPTDNRYAGGVTKGIVANTDRQAVSYGGYMMVVLQVDSAGGISNTGGALVNMYGQVVGINTVRRTDKGELEYGCAVPMSSAKPVIESLIARGYVKDRVDLGLQVLQVDKTLSKMNNVPTGLYIKEVEQDSVLYRNNVRQGDVITQLNGGNVEDVSAFLRTVEKMRPGDKVKFKIYRKGSAGSGNTFEVTVTLEENK